MAGLLIHLIAGGAVAIAGRYYYNDYFKGDKYRERLYLAIVCILFSVLPDAFLGVYYLFPGITVEMMNLHVFLHMVIFPASIIGLYLLKVKYDVKYEPIIVMGLWCIVLHMVLDFTFIESGILI